MLWQNLSRGAHRGDSIILARCEWTEVCSFFTDEVGYSIDLQAAMRIEYCMGDNSNCARLLAMDVLPVDEIPADLLPTEHERLAKLGEEYRARKR